MKSIRVALVGLFVTALSGDVRTQSQPALAIIVHRSNPVENLTHAELRQILLLERQSWPNNKKITVVMRDSGQTERALILRAVCNMSESDFDRHVLQATFRGTALAPPRTISTAEGMRRFVFNVPGAVGYLRAEEVDDTVKVVPIDGKLPGAAGYALTVALALTPDSAPSILRR